MAESSRAVVSAPSRKIFAPMFRARWQNMQNIINDSGFIDMIPQPYLSYYMAFIRQCLQWSTGFVPMLHRSDFFSTGIGYTVIDIFVKECMSGGYRITSSDKNLEKFFEEWEEKYELYNELCKMFWNTNAGGNSLMVLSAADNNVYVTAYPINRCFFQIGRTGQITNAVLLNRFVAGETAFYAKEYRVYYKGEPYFYVQLGQGTLVNSPSWQGSSLRKVPKNIAAQWNYVYGADIKPNKWYKLPFESLGVYNIKNKAVAVALADMPGYSDSTLYTALDILYSIDYNFTQGQVDMYMGKSRALIPKQLKAAEINTRNISAGMSFTEAIQLPALEDDFYTEVTGGYNGEAIKPTFIQADLRGEARRYIRDSDLELLASKVGLSSSTLANHLTYNTSKTATEVKEEKDTTEKSVDNKRALATPVLNLMLSEIAKFYGFNDEVSLEWGRAGCNSSTENQELLTEYQAGVLPLRKYLEKRWNDLSKDEIEFWAKEIEEAQKQRAELNTFGNIFNDDGDYLQEVNENESGGGQS